MIVKQMRLSEEAYRITRIISAKRDVSMQLHLTQLFGYLVWREKEGLVPVDFPLSGRGREGRDRLISVRLSNEVKYRLNIQAATRNTSLSNYLESIIDYMVREYVDSMKLWIDDKMPGKEDFYA